MGEKKKELKKINGKEGGKEGMGKNVLDQSFVIFNTGGEATNESEEDMEGKYLCGRKSRKTLIMLTNKKGMVGEEGTKKKYGL